MRGQRARFTPVGWDPDSTHRGHLIARQFGGPDGVQNVVAQWESTNLGPYRQAENAVESAIEQDCNEVLVDVTVNYHDRSETAEMLFARNRLPADSFTYEAHTDTGTILFGENPMLILNRQDDRP